MKDKVNLKGTYRVEHFDADDNLKGIYEFPNSIVDEGVHHIFDTEFNSGSQITTWYVGLIDNSGFSTFATSHTLASHAGWSENTNYSEANRVTWNSDAAATRAITNGNTADFSINASGNLKGIFISSNNVKSTGNTGTLMSEAAFSSVVAVSNGDTLKVTYTITAS
jgi:hypothetical protein